MTLYVSLVLKVESVLVGKIVEIWVVGIMAEPDMIDVGSLHEHDLLGHLLSCDGMTSRRISLMPVYSLQLHGLAVDEEIASRISELVLLCRHLLNLNRAHAEISTRTVEYASTFVEQLGYEYIAMRFLGTPSLWMRNI